MTTTGNRLRSRACARYTCARYACALAAQSQPPDFRTDNHPP
jgi:hypothetical protein